VSHYRNICRQYAYFYRKLHTLPLARDWPLTRHFSFDAYRWAVDAVSSRVNSVPRPGGGSVLALVPCWDLVNHQTGQVSTDYHDSSGTLVCYANRSFRAGEQFTMAYGPRGNADLFLHCGFVVPGNLHSRVPLRLGLSTSDPLATTRQRALSQLGASPPYEVLAGASPLPPSLSAFARVFTAKEGTLAALTAPHCPSPSEEEQEAVRGFLRTRLGLLLRVLSQKPPAPPSPTTPLDALVRSFLDEEAALLRRALEALE